MAPHILIAKIPPLRRRRWLRLAPIGVFLLAVAGGFIGLLFLFGAFR